MEIYIFIGIVLLLLAFLNTFIDVENEKIKDIIVFLYLIVGFLAFIFVGFRKDCGFDYDSYLYYFNELDNPNWFDSAISMNLELGYAFLNNLLGNFRVLLVVMAFLTISLQFSFFYKYSPIPFLSLFMFLGTAFYPSIMGQYRQALAMGFVYFAFVNVQNRIKFILIILIASFFHSSSLLALLAIFIPQKLFSTKFYVFLLIGAYIVNLTMKDLFLSFTEYFPSQMGDKISFYAITEDSILGLNLAFIIRTAIFFIFLSLKDKLLEIPFGFYFLNIYFVSMIIYLGLGFIPQIGIRGSDYFYSIELVLAPMIIFKFGGLKRVVFFLLFIGIAMLRQVKFFLDPDAFAYFPYQTDFFKIFGL